MLPLRLPWPSGIPPVECVPASMMKRDRSLVAWRFGCQSLS
jgi:hypothetical protein